MIKSLETKAFLYTDVSKLSILSRAKPRTQRFGLSVIFRRLTSSLYESYRTGRTSTSTLLINHIVQAVILLRHDAFAELQRFSEPLERLA